ncbi:MAG: MMPL family transporter, partial [Deltaproteobacteria bacterium]
AMEAHSSLRKEIVKNFLSSAAIIILLFQIVYRKRPLVLFLTSITLLAALSYTLGAAYLLFGGLNMVSSVVAVMLLGMGIDYIIHMFNRWEEAYRQTGDTAVSIKEAFTRVFPGIATGAVTTSLAFLSIVFTDFRGLYEFGIIAGIGALACLLMMVFFMCSCLCLFPEALASKRPSKSPFLDKAAGMVIGNKGIIIIIIGGVALVISAALIPSIRFDSDPQSLGIKESPVAKLEKKVSETFSTGKNPLIAVVGAPDKEGLFNAFGSLEERLKALEGSKITASHRSLAVFLPPPNAQKAALAELPGVRDASVGIEKRFIAALRENGFRGDEYQKKYIEKIAEALRIT